MVEQNIWIENIPAMLWGGKSTKLIVAVHGNLSNKADVPIAILAQEAMALGYRVLSFDLPQHGDRKDEPTLCNAQNCVHDLSAVMHFARAHSDRISLFACSIGAYFSLLAYKDVPIRQSLFLSPIVDLGRMIDNLMSWFAIGKERLQAEREIKTPLGHVLDWDYYCYVKENPIVRWRCPTDILCGSADNVGECDVVSAFATRFFCSLTVLENGEHFFHTPEQLRFYRKWLQEKLRA